MPNKEESRSQISKEKKKRNRKTGQIGTLALDPPFPLLEKNYYWLIIATRRSVLPSLLIDPLSTRSDVVHFQAEEPPLRVASFDAGAGLVHLPFPLVIDPWLGNAWLLIN